MLGYMLTTAISIAALLLSAITFGLAHRASKAAERRSRIPVLVFVYDPLSGWQLHNVGNGPALNVEVAQKVVGGERAGAWINPVRVPPLGRDKAVVLEWLEHDNSHGLGAVYEDFLSADEARAGRLYTVICSKDRNVVTPGRHLPTWTENEIRAQWQVKP